MDKKDFHTEIELKADAEGSFTATIATLNVMDKDRDVTLPGAFTEGQAIKIASWGHKWSELPVGMGVLHADNKKAWVDGQFFLDTTPGLETYKTVKALGKLQEWSYGFKILDAMWGEQDGEEVRFLKALDVFEASPVMVGAGVGTRTTSIKGATTFSDHIARVLDEVKALNDRAEEIATLRAKEGRVLSTASRQELSQVYEQLEVSYTRLKTFLDTHQVEPPKNDSADPPPVVEPDPLSLFMEWQRVQAQILGHIQ